MDILTTIKTIKKNKRQAWGVAFLAGCTVAFIAALSFSESALNLGKEEMRAQTPMKLLQLQRGLQEAEIGQRGYLLTHRKEYLLSFNRASRQMEESLYFLDHHFENVPEAKTVLQQFHQLTEARLSELMQAIRLNDEGKTAPALETTVLSDLQKAQMDQVQSLSQELQGKESLRLAADHYNTEKALLISHLFLASLFALGVLAFYLYWRESAALLDLQQQLKKAAMGRPERQTVEAEVTRRTAALAKLTHHLQIAREDERQRIAQDLHDELGSLLMAAKLDATRAKSQLIETAPDAAGLLSHLIDTLNSCFTLKQRIIEGLHPPSLAHLGLVATLDNLAREFAEQTGIQMHCDLTPVKLEPAAELVIYRAVQESFTNIKKYAQAHNVWLTLKPQQGFVHVSVQDDGVGFDDSTTPPGSAHGLAGMRFRVEAEGGSFVIQSTSGHGTLIRAKLPTTAGMDGAYSSAAIRRQTAPTTS